MAAWGNVGALGFVNGVEAVVMRAQLVPDLADDVIYYYTSVVAGMSYQAGSVPLNFSLGLNHTDLSYGESIATGPSPVVFTSYENTTGGTAALSLWDIIGAGVGVKRFEVDLAAGLPGIDGRGEVTAWDYGILARSPKYPFRKTGEPEPRWRASLVGGVAWSNNGDDISLVEQRQADPLPYVRRESIGLDLDIIPASDFIHTSNKWMSRMISDVHLISFSGAIGRETSLITDESITYRGAEIRLLDSASIRFGHINDEIGQIIGSTFGWGISFLGWVGVEYARIPQYVELDDVTKWSLWIRLPLNATL
jgi:hypothetical protein